MMLAGYETTANTLAFCIYLLGKNPHAQQQLLQEVDGFKVLKCIVCRCTCTIVCICPQARCANEKPRIFMQSFLLENNFVDIMTLVKL